MSNNLCPDLPRVPWLAASRLTPYALGMLGIVTSYLFLLHGTAKLFGVPSLAMFAHLELVSLEGFAGRLFRSRAGKGPKRSGVRHAAASPLRRNADDGHRGSGLRLAPAWRRWYQWCLEELPAASTAVVFAEGDGPADREPSKLCRRGGALDALAGLAHTAAAAGLPPGSAYA